MQQLRKIKEQLSIMIIPISVGKDFQQNVANDRIENIVSKNKMKWLEVSTKTSSWRVVSIS